MQVANSKILQKLPDRPPKLSLDLPDHAKHVPSPPQFRFYYGQSNLSTASALNSLVFPLTLQCSANSRVLLSSNLLAYLDPTASQGCSQGDFRKSFLLLNPNPFVDSLP